MQVNTWVLHYITGGKTRRYGDDRVSAMRLVMLSADIRTDTAVFREDKVTLVKNILTGLTK